MTWENFYLLCFGVGLVFSVLSLVTGLGHLHVSHLPIGHGVSLGHMNGGHIARGGSSGQGAASLWNGFTITAFLCWFGGAGYLITRHGSFLVSAVLLLATLSGIFGGGLVFLFLARVVAPHEHELTAEETAITGVVARVSAAIRPYGVGEISYTQLGALCSAPAKADLGGAIEKDEEVYVVRYESGIAYVRRWEDLPITDFEHKS
jgi:hypothetical protein